jgi:hypothetical protein
MDRNDYHLLFTRLASSLIQPLRASSVTSATFS